MISCGSPHVRPMGRTCGEPDEIELTAMGVKLNGSRCRLPADQQPHHGLHRPGHDELEPHGPRRRLLRVPRCVPHWRQVHGHRLTVCKRTHEHDPKQPAACCTMTTREYDPKQPAACRAKRHSFPSSSIPGACLGCTCASLPHPRRMGPSTSPFPRPMCPPTSPFTEAARLPARRYNWGAGGYFTNEFFLGN